MGTRKKIEVKIISAENDYFAGEADCLFVPTKKGETAILPFHTPIVLIMSSGKVRVLLDGKKEEIVEIKKGILRVDDNKAYVLVNL